MEGYGKFVRVVMKPNQRGPAALEGVLMSTDMGGVRLRLSDRTVAGVHLKSADIIVPRENYSYLILADEPITVGKEKGDV